MSDVTGRADAARIAAVIITTAGLGLLAVGCGGSAGAHVAQLGSITTQNTSNLSAASAQENRPLAFSRCVRSHGVSKFPDAANPKVDLRQLGVSGSQFQAAQNACRYLSTNSEASIT
jgi:hypothetical protein